MLAVFLVQLPFVAEPLTIDEAMYFAVAQSDALPYVDVLDQKPPMVYAWYKLALVLGGGVASEEALRLLAASVLAVTGYCVYRLGRMAGGARIGVAAVWIFALLVANPVVVRDANTETFALLPFVLGLLAWTRGMQGSKRWHSSLTRSADPHPSPLRCGERGLGRSGYSSWRGRALRSLLPPRLRLGFRWWCWRSSRIGEGCGIVWR